MPTFYVHRSDDSVTEIVIESANAEEQYNRLCWEMDCSIFEYVSKHDYWLQIFVLSSGRLSSMVVELMYVPKIVRMHKLIGV
jgi:hypothetical protein